MSDTVFPSLEWNLSATLEGASTLAGELKLRSSWDHTSEPQNSGNALLKLTWTEEGNYNYGYLWYKAQVQGMKQCIKKKKKKERKAIQVKFLIESGTSEKLECLLKRCWTRYCFKTTTTVLSPDCCWYRILTHWDFEFLHPLFYFLRNHPLDQELLKKKSQKLLLNHIVSTEWAFCILFDRRHEFAFLAIMFT